MADSDNYQDPLNDEPPTSGPPWGPIIVVIIFIGMGILAFWVTHEKKNEQARTAVVQALDKELADDEKAVNAQRERVTDLTKQVEDLRTQIQLGARKDKKIAIDEFNALAAQQRAARDTFVQMADQYNQKVAKYHQLEQ